MRHFGRLTIALFLFVVVSLAPDILHRSAWVEFLFKTGHPQSRIRPWRLGVDFIELAISTDYFIVTFNYRLHMLRNHCLLISEIS